MGGISMPQGKGNQRHNLRENENELHNVDKLRTKDNVVIKNEELSAAYHRIFDAAVAEYNSKQTRSDRKIKSYEDKIAKSMNGEKLFYEDVLQWGKKEDFQADPGLRVIAKECLEEYIQGFQDRNPNLQLIGAYIHMDEASPHMHFDYIPVASGYKTGLAKRNSLDRAMRSMGYGSDRTKQDRKNNATKEWKDSERSVFEKICIKHGLSVDKEQHLNRKQLAVPEYKEMIHEVEKGNLKVRFNQSKISNQTKHLEQLEASLEQVENNLQLKNEDLQGVERLFDIRKDQITILNDQISDLREEYGEAKVKYNTDLLKADYEDLRGHISDLKEEEAELQHKVSSLNQTIGKLKDKMQDLLAPFYQLLGIYQVRVEGAIKRLDEPVVKISADIAHDGVKSVNSPLKEISEAVDHTIDKIADDAIQVIRKRRGR